MNSAKKKVCKDSCVHLVLHGGLGNQLFQLFISYLLLLSENIGKLKIDVQYLGKYSQARNLEVANLLLFEKSIQHKLLNKNSLLNIRISKITHKIFRFEKIYRYPFLGYVVDGYFQSLSNYSSFDKISIAEILLIWRTKLINQNLLLNQDIDTIYHMRLGDFFNNDKAALFHVQNRLSLVNEKILIVSDQGHLVQEAIKLSNDPSLFKLVDTENFNSWELFALFSRSKRIYTNGSTLAFWASVLAKSKFFSDNKIHMKLHELFTSV